MSETQNGKATRSISEIRAEVIQDETRFIEDPLNREYKTQWKVFCRLHPSQITPEIVHNLLKAEEAYTREQATQQLEVYGGSGVTYAYHWWEDVSEALKGLEGKGSRSKTIGYLRKNASDWQRMSNKNILVIDQGGPYGENPLREAATAEEQVRVWTQIVTNLNTAARLIENQPHFVLQENAVTE